MSVVSYHSFVNEFLTHVSLSLWFLNLSIQCTLKSSGNWTCSLSDNQAILEGILLKSGLNIKTQRVNKTDT